MQGGMYMENEKKEKWTSKLIKKIKENKLITTTIATLILFSIINIIMIHNFFYILGNFSFPSI